MQLSPLNDRHVALGAKFAEFGGWSMPLQYSGIVDEHHATRSAVGIFDVSHLGKLSVTGKGALDFCNTVLANDLDKVGPGRAQYTMLCTPEGGVVDDLIAYVNSPDDVFCIPNAANNAEVVRILTELAPEGIAVTNRHAEFAVLAVQGPRSADLLRDLGYPVDLAYMSFGYVPERPGVSVCRTGYTGEHGYELVIPSGEAAAVFDDLMAAGEKYDARPAGLGARDTLRTEMGYALHGQDISPDIDPVSAGLGWAIGWAKPAFRGSEALRAIKDAGPKRRQRGLRSLGRGIPRPGMAVLDADGTEIGVVTSGTFSPTLKIGIGLALVDANVKPGDEVSVAVRNRVEPFAVVKPPFVEAGVK